jgi:catechol 2,3-dioxygenase-like lactoylglutathione lyase family enzyme/uncharacterized protein YunC (DUF1805 family)
MSSQVDCQQPRSEQRVLRFAGGPAIGLSQRWRGGQYCAILTPAGLVGCGIFDLETPARFGQALAIARGTPQAPLVEPEDLLTARIVGCTPQAAALGVAAGMTGSEAVEQLLAAGRASSPDRKPASDADAAEPPPIRVRGIDHVTFVSRDLARSRSFYVDVLGMTEVPRPAFSFPGLWFQAGGTQIHLIGEHRESGPAGTHIAPEANVSRTRHVAFEVDDARLAVARLRALGVEIVAGPKQRPDGPTQLYLLDPDGNLIELFSVLTSEG